MSGTSPKSESGVGLIASLTRCRALTPQTIINVSATFILSSLLVDCSGRISVRVLVALSFSTSFRISDKSCTRYLDISFPLSASA